MANAMGTAGKSIKDDLSCRYHIQFVLKNQGHLPRRGDLKVRTEISNSISLEQSFTSVPCRRAFFEARNERFETAF